MLFAMTKSIKIDLPKLGESIVSATVVRWFKKVGDPVALDEPLLEVSTDKVNSEIPSPVAGVLEQILVEPDQEVQVGEALAIVASKEAPSIRKEEPLAAPPCPLSEENETFLSPSVLRLLKERNIPLSEVDKIPRTGERGRLTKKDVEEYTPSQALSSLAPERGDTERVKMTAMRKAIADNMVRSFYEAPHASLFTEVDVTALSQKIKKEKELFFQKHGVKLSITAFAARAICRALQSYPLLNASLDGDTIVMKRYVNLGVAVSVDQGVMVPVIKTCQRLGVVEISKEIALLAEKARSHKLAAPDVQEGTVTMTNFGMTGTMIGVPIIRYPEVAIVGLGAITKKVAALSDDTIGIRSVMWVSLTFDHRVLDGLYGCGFLNELKRQLEEDLSL